MEQREKEKERRNSEREKTSAKVNEVKQLETNSVPAKEPPKPTNKGIHGDIGDRPPLAEAVNHQPLHQNDRLQQPSPTIPPQLQQLFQQQQQQQQMLQQQQQLKRNEDLARSKSIQNKEIDLSAFASLAVGNPIDIQGAITAEDLEASFHTETDVSTDDNEKNNNPQPPGPRLPPGFERMKGSMMQSPQHKLPIQQGSPQPPPANDVLGVQSLASMAFNQSPASSPLPMFGGPMMMPGLRYPIPPFGGLPLSREAGPSPLIL